MKGQRLIMNDGTIIENGSAGYAEGCLWLKLPGYTMQQAAALAFDDEKTSRVVFQYGEMSDTYEGFTNCVNINQDYDGLVSVCMKKVSE